MNRREFLQGSAWMGVLAAAQGCRGLSLPGNGGKMALYADKPFEHLRVAVIGLRRGIVGVRGFAAIPTCEVRAVCDLNDVNIKRALDEVKKAGCSYVPRTYTGIEDWKRICDSDDIDLVYNATPWQLHTPIALYAMRAGKHVVTEVPSAFTVDDCWELVETSEKLERHCMMLENCCYGETEMLALNLVRQGKLGELVHGEGAYIHDLRDYNYGDWLEDSPGWDYHHKHHAYWDYWRLKHNKEHKGNQYTTHGLGPICQYMDVNRGDRFDYLVSLESDQFNFEAYAKANYPADHWKAKTKVEMGDMNTLLIKTARGRSIMVQHDVSSPRPYTRINTITGTKGILTDYPYRVGWEEKSGKGVHEYFPADRAEKVRQDFMHPLWKQAGKLAKMKGGHGGMDFLMVLRLAHCLQNGLPLDQNVYDLASWCCLCELSEKSVRNRSRSLDIPDFTRGGWKKTPALGIESVDLAKMGFRI